MRRVWVYAVIDKEGGCDYKMREEPLHKLKPGEMLCTTTSNLSFLAEMLKKKCKHKKEERAINFRPPFDAYVGADGEIWSGLTWRPLTEDEIREFRIAFEKHKVL